MIVTTRETRETQKKTATRETEAIQETQETEELGVGALLVVGRLEAPHIKL